MRKRNSNFSLYEETYIYLEAIGAEFGVANRSAILDALLTVFSRAGEDETKAQMEGRFKDVIYQRLNSKVVPVMRGSTFRDSLEVSDISDHPEGH